MSPEQATLGKVDARSDVFSFGALLYEMVTGRRAFAGTSTSETLSAVIKNQPTSPRELVPEIPEPLERIILRCLRKEPARRFQHMADVKVELEEVKDDSDSYAVASAGTVPGKRMRRRSWLMWAAPTLLILTIAGAGMLWRTRSPARPAPSVVQLSTERWANGGSFSPDGTQIAYASAGDAGTNWDIWLKIVGQAEARRLTTDPASENQPAWVSGREPGCIRALPLRHYERPHLERDGQHLYSIAARWRGTPVGRLSDAVPALLVRRRPLVGGGEGAPGERPAWRHPPDLHGDW
jgi:hypothetical protein